MSLSLATYNEVDSQVLVFSLVFFVCFFLNSHVYTVVCTVTDRQKQNKKKRIPFFNKCPEFGQIMSPCCCHVVLYMRHPNKVADSISALAFTSVCVSVHLLSAPQKVNNPHDQGMGLLFTAFFFFLFLNCCYNYWSNEAVGAAGRVKDSVIRH